MICKRCLLEEMEDQVPLYCLIQEAIAAIPEDKSAAPDMYRARLEKCKSCDHLHSGMCALCGCYVEVRAAQRLRRCPDEPPRWITG